MKSTRPGDTKRILFAHESSLGLVKPIIVGGFALLSTLAFELTSPSYRISTAAHRTKFMSQQRVYGLRSAFNASHLSSKRLSSKRFFTSKPSRRALLLDLVSTTKGHACRTLLSATQHICIRVFELSRDSVRSYFPSSSMVPTLNRRKFRDTYVLLIHLSARSWNIGVFVQDLPPTL